MLTFGADPSLLKLSKLWLLGCEKCLESPKKQNSICAPSFPLCNYADKSRRTEDQIYGKQDFVRLMLLMFPDHTIAFLKKKKLCLKTKTEIRKMVSKLRFLEFQTQICVRMTCIGENEMGLLAFNRHGIFENNSILRDVEISTVLPFSAPLVA